MPKKKSAVIGKYSSITLCQDVLWKIIHRVLSTSHRINSIYLNINAFLIFIWGFNNLRATGPILGEDKSEQLLI